MYYKISKIERWFWYKFIFKNFNHTKRFVNKLNKLYKWNQISRLKFVINKEIKQTKKGNLIITENGSSNERLKKFYNNFICIYHINLYTVVYLPIQNLIKTFLCWFSKIKFCIYNPIYYFLSKFYLIQIMFYFLLVCFSKSIQKRWKNKKRYQSKIFFILNFTLF